MEASVAAPGKVVRPQAAPVVPAIPFVAAAHEHTEQFPQSITQAIGSATTTTLTIPSYGYLRNVFLQVALTGGTGGTPVTDAPWTLLSDITLIDTNGAPLVGPLSGFQLLQANIWGGYANQSDPRTLTSALGGTYTSTTPNYTFGLRVPVEISHRDGRGSLANQNAAAPYRLRITVNATASTWSVAPSPLPTITITPFLEAWSVPAEVDARGVPQAQIPPDHGVLQYWSVGQAAVVAGNNFTPIQRVGNLLRNIVVIARNGSAARADNVFPDPAILSWDARQMFNDSQFYRKQQALEKLEPNGVRDTGVFPYTMDHALQNKVGDEMPVLWYPTVQATRLEVDGTSAAAGTLEILLNDVAPQTSDQARRYIETSGTGFHPNPDLV